jgi:uncharacterized membrane protein HdeD (DUF308 family)
MKRFKKIDLIVQIVLLLVTIAFFVSTSLAAISLLYLLLFWQLLSICIHVINKWNVRKRGIRYYFNFLVVFDIVLVIAFMIWMNLPSVMALFIDVSIPAYTVLCCYEVFHFARRPLDLI